MISKNKIKQNFITIALFILFKIILDYSYINFVSVVYNYDGYLLNINESKVIEGWILYFAFIFILKKNTSHVLFPIFTVITLTLITPSISLYSLRGEARWMIYMNLIPYFIIFSFLSLNKSFNVKNFRDGKYFALRISLFFTLVVFAHYLYVVGLGNMNFNLLDVYVFRDEYEQANSTGIFGYLNGWVNKVFNIFLICYAIFKKNLKLFVLFILVQIIFFGLSGHKIVLFTPILIGMFYIVDRFNNKCNFIILSLVSVMSLALMLTFFTDNQLFASLLMRRGFFVPANLNFVYLEFFSTNDFIYWSNSVLKYFIDYPYELSATHVIGEYLGNPRMGANTGFIGSGYMQMGLVGIITYTIIITILLTLINSFKNLPNWLLNSVMVIPLISVFSGSDLPTSFLTHGVIVSTLLLWLLNSNYTNLKKE